MASEKSILNKLVDRTYDDSFFFGWVIHKFLSIHNETKERLANRLACTISVLDRLALCRLPEEHDDRFLAKIQQVARYAGVDSDSLLSIVREVQSLGALQEISDQEVSQVLMAARFKKREPDDPEDSN